MSNEIVEAYRLGGTIRGLARTYDVHRFTIQKHLDKAGIEREPTKRALTDKQVQECVERYTTGESWKTIADHFGIDPTTVGRTLKERAVVMRPRRGGKRT